MEDQRLSTVLRSETEFEDDILEDPKTWRRSYLNVQCVLYEIENIYTYFKEKVQHGFFTLFLVLQAVLSLVHFALVLRYNIKDPSVVQIDLILYALLCLLALAGLLIKEKFITQAYVDKSKEDAQGNSQDRISETEDRHEESKSEDTLVGLILSFLTLFILLTVDLTIPLYHLLQSHTPNLRPAYATLSIIACYVFFPISKDLYAIILGATATICNVIVIGCVTYKDSSNLTWHLISDIIYYICVNVVFLVLRHLNEIMKARTFLERYYGIQKKYRLDILRRKENTLLTRMIPHHVANEVGKLIRNSEGSQFQVNGISEYDINRFFTKYDNVTILYADIVHYTAMTTTINVIELVEILTDLFGNFDRASAENNVMRIKFLGDCYYCVAGLPLQQIPDEDSISKKNPKLSKTKTHSDNCVALGIDMINIIRSVRNERNIRKSRDNKPKLTIDMRIGVHTGSIWGGIIGRTKWQYDIWSKDVVIANKMESSGSAGKVHISQQTKDHLTLKHGNGEFVENTNLSENEDLLKLGITKSYFISPKEEEQTSTKHRVKSINTQSSVSKAENKQSRTTIEGDVIGQYQEIAKYCKKNMEEAIRKMQLNKFKQWFHPEDIHPFLLTFSKKSKISNMEFFKEPDPLFKYYILIATFVSFCLILLQYENWYQSHWNWENNLPYITFGLLFLILLPMMWLGSYQGSSLETSLKKISIDHLKNSMSLRRKSALAKNENNAAAMRRAELQNGGTNRMRLMSTDTNEDEVQKTIFAKMSDYVTNSVSVRVALYAITCTLFAASTLTELMVCSVDYLAPTEEQVKVNITKADGAMDNPVCKPAWTVTLAFALVLFMNFLFYKISVWIKLFFTFITTTLYVYFILSTDIFEGIGTTWNMNMPQEISHIISIIFLAVILHLIDRQTEYMNRLGFKWHHSINMEQEKIYRTRAINYSLLTNILPNYIAQIYINKEHSSLEVYHKLFRSVAVMFASVVYNFKIEDLNEKSSLETMNTVISGFDKLLLTNTNYVDTVEKIKIAGWTYMAASGITPDENNLTSKRRRSPGNRHPLCIMVDFAGDMMDVLDEINKKYNLDFKLKVGIAFGPVTAGVVGSKKPFYDIWGDAVNMASRMDSTGVCKKIQILEDEKRILKHYNYECEYRSQVFVKGKGDVPTYFVKPYRRNHTVDNLRKQLTNDEIVTQEESRSTEGIIENISNKKSSKPKPSKPKTDIDEESSYL